MAASEVSVAVAEKTKTRETPPPCSADDSANNEEVSFKKGDEIEVFFRFEHSPREKDDPLFPVSSPIAALQAPRMGMTDGWISGVVQQDFPPPKSAEKANGKPPPGAGFVHVSLSHVLWANRTGKFCRNGEIEAKTQYRAKPQDVRFRGEAPKPKLSFICLRWGVWSPYHDKDGAWGGWGPMGTCICDKYIKGFFDTVYERLGPCYEVISCFIGNSADLRRLAAPSLAAQLTARSGGFTAAMYFLWPVAWLDGHAGELNQDDLAGYVEDDALFSTMRSLEAAGIPTRHPHPSHLYRLLCSKVWSAHMCLSPDFHVPATTRVSRAFGLVDPFAAAGCALDALCSLLDQQLKLVGRADETGKRNGSTSLSSFRGVAKLGFAWEAREVYHFTGQQELADKLRALLHQPGSTAEAVIVQRYVPHDCEVRVYCLHGKPEKLLYTRFSSVNDDGSPGGFRALERKEAVEQWFGSKDSGLAVAEQLILQTLVPRWVNWLRTESCEIPSVIRMDFFVKVLKDDEAEVTIGELTEQGASTLGWEEGAKRVFHSIVDCCLYEVPRTPYLASAEEVAGTGPDTNVAPVKRRKA